MKTFVIKRKYWLIVLLALVVACTKYVSQNARWIGPVLNDAPATGMAKVLKVHLKSGELGVLHQWELGQDTLRGQGIHYSSVRNTIKTGKIEFPASEVALYEMNEAPENPDELRGVGLGVQIIGNVAVLVACLVNPKACYGSCPTFYIPGQENIHQTVAEGFSESTMPGLEARDVDALRTAAAGGERFHLIMKNEAYETHAVNELALLAAPKKAGTTVLQGNDDHFYRCLSPKLPLSALAAEGDCLAQLAKADGNERFSRTDSSDLAKREEIFLQFGPVTAGQHGLLLDFRNTQVTTFLFYSALSYMGDEMVNIQHNLDQEGDFSAILEPMKMHMGGIEVFYRTSPGNAWTKAGEVLEAGPIAINRQLVPFQLASDAPSLEVKLRLAQGNWRLDFAGLAAVQEEVSPSVLAPVSLQHNGKEAPQWLPLLAQKDEQRLASMPGEQWLIGFDLPAGSKQYEVFLAATGYYLEWNREVWKKDKNLIKLKRMFDLNKKTWRELAFEFKTLEAEAETVFWSSRVPVQ